LWIKHMFDPVQADLGVGNAKLGGCKDLPSGRPGGSVHGSLQYAYIPIDLATNTSET
jgi:hypothetical protein